MFRLGKKIFCRWTPPPPRIARTCYGYAAGGMPLAFTQEDVLLWFILTWDLFTKWIVWFKCYICKNLVKRHIYLKVGCNEIQNFLFTERLGVEFTKKSDPLFFVCPACAQADTILCFIFNLLFNFVTFDLQLDLQVIHRLKHTSFLTKRFNSLKPTCGRP